MSQAKIYVGNLSYDVTSNDLQDHFAKYGEIAEVKLITDRGTGRSKGFAFITFASDQSAKDSLASDGIELSGRKMKVNEAKEEVRRSGGGGGGGRGGRRDGGDRRW
jgi:RNA recognition motif-containing protein